MSACRGTTVLASVCKRLVGPSEIGARIPRSQEKPKWSIITSSKKLPLFSHFSTTPS